MKFLSYIDSSAQRLLMGAAMVCLIGIGTSLAQQDRPEGQQQPNRPRVEEQRRAMQDRAAQLRDKLKDLEAAGKMDQAREVKAQLGELENQMRSGPQPQAMARFQERLARLGVEIQELRQNGRNEEADRLEREARDIKSQFQGPPQLGPRQEGMRQPPPPMGDLQSRMQHLQIAIDNLHAAGMHDQAERLQQQAEQFKRQMPQRQGPPPGGSEQMAGSFRQMQNELNQLRKEVMELRRLVQDLAEKRR
jgi:hypothetical protein